MNTTPRTLALSLALGLGIATAAAVAPTPAGAIGGYSTPLPQLTVELDDAVEDAGVMEGRIVLSAPVDEYLAAFVFVQFPQAGPEDIGCPVWDTDNCSYSIGLDVEAGETEVPFEIDLISDDGPEPAELLRVSVNNVYPTGRVKAGVTTDALIYDGDGLDLALVDDPTAVEGDPGSDGTLDLVVEADQAVPFPVSFRVRTSAAGGYNAATAGVDYEPVDVIVELPAGDTSIAVPVPLVGDQLDEATQELFFGNLSELSDGEIALSGATTVARIEDDDARAIGGKTSGYQSSSRSARSAALTA